MTIFAMQEERARAEAGDWLARLQRSDVSERDGLEFDAWLEAPGNLAAYRQVLGVWHEFTAGADEVLAELGRPPAMSARPRTRRWMVGAGGFAMAAGLALAVLPPTLLSSPAQTYVTGTGEHRKVTLEDGSVLDLNAETRLTVSFSRSGRRVELGEGEAIFDVAHDARRPFTVAASNRVVRVVGTQFDVRNRAGQLVVTVARGKVQVRPDAAASAGHARLLTAGQRLAVDQAGAETLQAVDPREALGWRTGLLVYRNRPLAEVVGDMNRQFGQHIEIGDADLAAIPITGTVVLDDPQAVIARLSLMLPIRSVPSERGLLLLRK